MAYDGVGRTTVSYATDGGGDSGYSDDGNVTGDIVLQQSELSYDAAGRVLSALTRERFHDASGTGALGNPSSGIGARVSYAGYYYDAGGRSIAMVNVGTNGGSSWTWPENRFCSSTLITSRSAPFATNCVHPPPTCRGTTSDTRRTSMREEEWMNNPVSISSASEGVCLLCGAEGPTFAVSTPCSRLAGLPVCAKDLFTIVVAQNRLSVSATRGPVRGRAKPTSKPRTDSEDGAFASELDAAAAIPTIAITSAA